MRRKRDYSVQEVLVGGLCIERGQRRGQVLASQQRRGVDAFRILFFEAISFLCFLLTGDPCTFAGEGP